MDFSHNIVRDFEQRLLIELRVQLMVSFALTYSKVKFTSNGVSIFYLPYCD
jgi:hypothetical protein